MRRAKTTFALLGVIALLGCGRQAAPENDNAPEEKFETVIPPDNGTYLPTTVGAKWIYEITYDKPVSPIYSGIRTYGVTRVDDSDGAKLVTRGRLKRNGEVAEPVIWKVAPDGLYIMAGAWIKQDEPLLELKLPHKAGASWNRGENGPHEYTAHGPEDVEVPAGTFKAIRVVTHTGQSQRTMWYAPGIGLVKEEVDDYWPPERPMGKNKTVLKAFRPGKE